MNMKEEDFPFYQFLVSQYSDNPGVKRAIDGFEKAQTGSDEEKFEFAYGIQTGLGDKNTWPPGATEDMVLKTLQSCLAVFEDIASRNHVKGTAAAAYFHAFGFGCTADVGKANDLIEKAAALARASDTDVGFAAGMAQFIPPRSMSQGKSPTRKHPRP
ncbi:MAG: hypothetical protein HY052_04220 [Proteobacteria bacterium]|nr:hypothetical protein [Pseudomonadota bacterium]